MFLRLGAVMGARLRSLPRCCSDADLHQLVTCSKVVFQSSSGVDQARCAFGKPTRQISCLFQVAFLHWQCSGKKCRAESSCWQLPRLHFMRIKPSGTEGVLRAMACLQRLHVQCLVVVPHSFLGKEGKELLPEVQTICFCAQNL